MVHYSPGYTIPLLTDDKCILQLAFLMGITYLVSKPQSKPPTDEPNRGPNSISRILNYLNPRLLPVSGLIVRI